MALTKLQFRTAIQQEIDDPSARRWSAANLDILTQLVLDELWARILDAAPYFTSQLDTLTADLTTPGYVDLRLTSTGDLSQRFYRLQKLTRNGVEYVPADPRDIGVEANEAIWAPDYTYVFFGNQLWLFPLERGPDVEIRYSYRPAVYNGLADTVSIEWPEGHEYAPILEAAARALTKGDVESMEQKRALAEAATREMMSAITRRHPGPMTPWGGESTLSWGSEE